MKNNARSNKITVSADGRGLVSQAGAVLLWETLRVTGLAVACQLHALGGGEGRQGETVSATDRGLSLVVTPVSVQVLFVVIA